MRVISFHIILCSMLWLAACGGSSSGGGNSSPQPDPLAAPDNLEADAGNAQVELTWGVVEDATSYTLYYAVTADIDINNPGSGDGNWDMVPDVASPHTVGDLDNGTSYYFVVTATDDERESTASNEVSSTPLAGVTGYNIQTHDVTVDGQENLYDYQWCNDNQIAVGGGYRPANAEASNTPLSIRHQGPTYSTSTLTGGWTGGLYNGNSTGSISVKRHMVCIDPPASHERIGPFRNSYPLQGQHETYTTTCPDELVLLVGGDRPGINDYGNLLTIHSRPTEQNSQWQTALLHQGGTTESTLTWGEAHCAAPVRGLSTQSSYQFRPEQQIPPGSHGERTLACGDGQHVLHGGPYAPSADLALPADVRLQRSYPDTNAEGQSIWRIRLFNGTDHPVPIGIFAVCAASDD